MTLDTKLGILALTAPGAASFYQHLMAQSLSASEQGDNPEILLYQPNALPFIEDIKKDDWQGITDRLISAVNHLASLGANKVAIPVNTVHLVIDEVIKACDIEIINLLEVVVLHLKDKGYQRPLVLGTIPTMTKLYPSILQAESMTPVALPDTVMQLIDSEIHTHLVPMQDIVKSRQTLQAVVKPYLSECDVLIKACTELHLAFDDDVDDIPCIDTTAVLASAMLY